jgi:hypothetical protein
MAKKRQKRHRKSLATLPASEATEGFSIVDGKKTDVAFTEDLLGDDELPPELCYHYGRDAVNEPKKRS